MGGEGEVEGKGDDEVADEEAEEVGARPPSRHNSLVVVILIAVQHPATANSNLYNPLNDLYQRQSQMGIDGDFPYNCPSTCEQLHKGGNKLR